MMASRYSEAIVVRTITQILTKYSVPVDKIKFDNDSYVVRLLLPEKDSLVVNLQNGNFRFLGAMIYSYKDLDRIIREQCVLMYSKTKERHI
jgi:hypothetical protein